jgi:holo-[acyl-carrier-protein] synthase
MIVGIGTDVCDIRRIEASLQRQGDRFAGKILGESEWQVCASPGCALAATRRELPGHTVFGQRSVL